MIAAVDAAAMIRTARAGNTLLCVSEDDLLAPYRARERRRHEELCAVLRANYHGFWPSKLAAGVSGGSEIRHLPHSYIEAFRQASRQGH